MIEILNGDFETINWKKSSSLKLYDNDQYEDYPTHWHTVMEIIMPIESIYTLNLSGRTEVLREGDIIIIAPGCVHSITAPPKGRRIIFQPNSVNLNFIKDIETLVSLLSPYTVIRPEDYPDIYQDLNRLMLEINEEYAKNNAFWEAEIYARLLLMFSLLGKNFAYKSVEDKKQMANQEEYTSKFMELCSFITEHCSEDLKLEDVAKLSGFSKYYFERLFKQFTGTSFYKYLNQKRITKAQELLIIPQNSVTDVAMSCGFSSISSFIRMFKQIKGCTPTEFKKMYWNKEFSLGDEDE